MVALSALPRLLGKGLKSHFPPALFFLKMDISSCTQMPAFFTSFVKVRISPQWLSELKRIFYTTWPAALLEIFLSCTRHFQKRGVGRHSAKGSPQKQQQQQTNKTTATTKNKTKQQLRKKTHKKPDTANNVCTIMTGLLLSLLSLSSKTRKFPHCEM